MVAEELGLSAVERRALQQQIMLFYTGVTRSADTILAEQSANIESTRPQLDLLRDLAASPLSGCAAATWTRSAPRCAESWEAKRKLASGVSNDQIDAAVTRALDAGASGAKLTGAGGGGFLLVICPAGASARRAREPGGHAGIAGEAGPPRLACRAQRDARHLELSGYEGALARRLDRGPRFRGAGGAESRSRYRPRYRWPRSRTRPGGGQRRPGRKVAVFLLTDGPHSTLRKARTKRDELGSSGDYRIAVVLGGRPSGPACGWRRWPRGCRPRPSSWWSTVTWSRKVPDGFSAGDLQRVAARLSARADVLSRLGRQSFLYSGMAPPGELVIALQGRAVARRGAAGPGRRGDQPGLRATGGRPTPCCG